MAKDIPLHIREAFEGLKKKYPFLIVLRKLNGHYYVYKQSSQWDKVNRKVKTQQSYLGRMTAEGAFIERSGKNPTFMNPLPKTDSRAVSLGALDEELLTSLSMNGRASLKFLGSRIGLSAPAVYKRVNSLKKRFDIKYIAEINTEKLGYLKFLIAVKFLENVPSTDEIRAAVGNRVNAQLALATKGSYDLVIYALGKNNLDITETVIAIRDGLADYPSEWYVINFWEHFNFVPLRDDFIDSLTKDLLVRERAVLKELNSNGSEEFVDIDRKHGFDEGRSSYTFYSLKEKEILSRITINMQDVPLKYIGIITVDIIERKKFKMHREKLMLYTIRENSSLTTNYVLGGDSGSPDGIIYLVPVYNEGDLEREAEDMRKLNLGARIDTAVVTNVIFGSFCFRRFDYTYSGQYKGLVKRGFKEVERINYEDTGRRKRPAKAKKTEEEIKLPGVEGET